MANTVIEFEYCSLTATPLIIKTKIWTQNLWLALFWRRLRLGLRTTSVRLPTNTSCRCTSLTTQSTLEDSFFPTQKKSSASLDWNSSTRRSLSHGRPSHPPSRACSRRWPSPSSLVRTPTPCTFTHSHMCTHIVYTNKPYAHVHTLTHTVFHFTLTLSLHYIHTLSLHYIHTHNSHTHPTQER